MVRTVGSGEITQALIDTQSDPSRTPYIKILINSVDYSDRLVYIEHHEEAYRDRAIIGLSNRDGSLDVLDLDGQEFEIGYGYDTTANGGSSTDKVDTATLWVKSHQVITLQGERIYQIYAEGQWMRLREQKVIAGVTGDVPFYNNTFNATKTVYGLIELIIEGAFGWTLNALPATDDGIIDAFSPVFDINQMPYENAAALLYRLIWMTKMYLRPKSGKAWDVVFPQTSDAVDKTYFSYKPHWFLEDAEKTILLIPNSIGVFCNQDPNGEWDTTAFPLITGTAVDQDQIDKYFELVQPFIAGNIRTQADADNRAAAILSKFKSEILANRLVIPHDAQIELYDRIQIEDKRVQ